MFFFFLWLRACVYSYRTRRQKYLFRVFLKYILSLSEKKNNQNSIIYAKNDVIKCLISTSTLYRIFWSLWYFFISVVSLDELMVFNPFLPTQYYTMTFTPLYLYSIKAHSFPYNENTYDGTMKIELCVTMTYTCKVLSINSHPSDLRTNQLI